MRKKKKSRRYKVGEHPQYDHAYDQAISNSSILNPEKRNLGNNYKTDHPEAGLYELIGEPGKDGYFQNGTEWHLAAIPVFKQELAELETRFKNWARQQVTDGKSLRPPTEWPDPLLHLRLSKEAILDIRKMEAVKLKKLIKEKKQEEVEKRRGEILPNGPLGRGGVKPDPAVKNGMWVIDGQRLKESADGIPHISEPDSPYDGMTLFHYKQMCKQWIENNGLTLDQLRAKRNEIHLKAVKKAHKEGKEPPAKKLVVTHSKLPVWMDRLGITKKDWPSVPKGSKIDEIEKEKETA